MRRLLKDLDPEDVFTAILLFIVVFSWMAIFAVLSRAPT